jgi:hypothetical protein
MKPKFTLRVTFTVNGHVYARPIEWKLAGCPNAHFKIAVEQQPSVLKGRYVTLTVAPETEYC